MKIYLALEGTFVFASAKSYSELRRKVRAYAVRWKCECQDNKGNFRFITAEGQAYTIIVQVVNV